MHKIYGLIFESKCESGFDWSTFQLTAVIFDKITFSLPDHRAVVHLKGQDPRSEFESLGRGVKS